jgi:hypothetical protein
MLVPAIRYGSPERKKRIPDLRTNGARSVGERGAAPDSADAPSNAEVPARRPRLLSVADMVLSPFLAEAIAAGRRRAR